MNYDGWGYPLKPTNNRKKNTEDLIIRVRNTARNYGKGGIFGTALQECADRLEKLQEENDTLRETLMKIMTENTIKLTEK
jgi:hypothetical protein